MAELKVKLVRSRIGCNPTQKKTLTALGLSRVGRMNTLPDNKPVRGMIERVKHLVEVTES